MSIEYDLYKMKSLVDDVFRDLKISLDKSVIEGDFVRFNASITIKKFNDASILYTGAIGNHGYGKFEAVFNEITVSADSLLAINSFNDNNSTIKAFISRRGKNGAKYYLVFQRTVQFIPTEETMQILSRALLDDLLDNDNVEAFNRLFAFIPKID